jgi:hypothetical protein
VSTMGKFDHIAELTGSDNYPSWRRAVELALAGEGLWNHCSNGTDPLDVAEYASSMPALATAGKPTAAELVLMKDWVKEDAQAKAIIGRRLSPIVQNMLGEKLTARQQWDMLLKRFARLDVTSQFELRTQLFSEKLKDADDASRYLSVFENGRRRFAEMQVTFTDEESIWMLLNGLPETPQWVVFRSLTIGLYKAPSTSTSAVASPKITFEEVATSFSEEANRQRGQQRIARPGSEYANAATVPSFERRINPTTGVRIHKNNPKGVPCENPVCSGLPRSLTHDREHCLQQGGGMEGKAPWGQRTERGGAKKKDIAASATESKPSTSSAPKIPSTETAAAASHHDGDWSCAVIEEIKLDSSSAPNDSDIACIAGQMLSTLLDSGTTSTLITDRKFFWTYSNTNVTVKTANHGTLVTSGRGDCVAELTVNNRTQRIRLGECLHAPGALINLLSVGRMVKKGWACNFLPSPPRCQLVYRGDCVGDIPMVGNLMFLDLRFILPSTPSPHIEISAFAKVPLSWDLWHARLGHPGGEAVKRLPHFATGAKVDASYPLHTCEPCIVAKHPRKPYPPSTSPRASNTLDLIHSDLCGPFPVMTPHGKHYFVIFLDDHSHFLNLQLLATKDQALEAWEIVQKRWENLSGRKVKVFRSDNGGEFIGTAFTQALTAAGITRQLSVPYAHQQNGKAERAIRTLEGRIFAMLETARLPANLWGEAALTACYLWNRTKSSTLAPGVTPYEVLNGRKPDLSHLRVFGARCFARIPIELQAKLGPHSRPAIFMGYPEGTKGYRLRDKETSAFFTARDVIFDENFPSVAHVNSSDSDADDEPLLPAPAPPASLVPPSASIAPPPASLMPPPALAPPPASPPAIPRRSSRSHVPTAAGRAYSDELAASKARLLTLRDARALRTTTANAPCEGVSEGVDTGNRLEDIPEDLTVVEANADVPEVMTNVVIEEQANVAIRSNRKRNPSTPDYDMAIPPATYDEAMKRSDREHWLTAMKAELSIMTEMHVYRLTKLPEVRKAIGNRWVLEFKEDNKGGPVYKARLVAQGFSQIPGVDYGATFAPVIKTASIRFIAALACRNNWELDTFDAKRAFLWGILKEEIYMRQPKGFEEGDWASLVWLMLRTIYGLKQSAMEWYEQVRAVMEELGFTRCVVDHAVFIYDKLTPSAGRIFCIIGWHVDDGMGASNSKAFLQQVKACIAKRFGIKDLGPIQKFLGIQFERDRLTRQLWMHQGEYIRKKGICHSGIYSHKCHYDSYDSYDWNKLDQLL